MLNETRNSGAAAVYSGISLVFSVLWCLGNVLSLLVSSHLSKFTLKIITENIFYFFVVNYNNYI